MNIFLKWCAVVLGLLTVALNLVLPAFPDFTESVFASAIYPRVTFIFTFLFNRIPFSVTEIVLAGLFLFILTGMILAFLRKWKWGKFLFLCLNVVSLLYAMFYFGWGFNYYRKPLIERMFITNSAIDSLAFRKAFDHVLEDANSSYRLVDSVDKQEVDRAVENGFKRVAELLHLEFPNGMRKPKALISNFILDKTLTNGFFSPVFHEIHLNSNLLPVEYPFTLAHEKSHQMGIASEAEANFLAYLVCLSSDNPVVQYSAKMEILGEFLIRARQTLADYPELREKVQPGILEDFRKINNRWRQHVGAVSRVSRKAYDRYLKANKITEGVDNYRGVVEMVVLWRMHAENFQK